MSFCFAQLYSLYEVNVNTESNSISSFCCCYLNSQLERATPFKRKIHPDEIWLYRNPRTDSYVPTEILWPFVFGIPCSIFLTHFLITKNKFEFIQANLAISLALGLNGIITNVLKLCVGKWFLYRCKILG